MGKDLFGGDSDDGGSKTELKTNKEYAKTYNNFKRKELLKKFNENEESSSGSDSESDLSEDELVHNPEFDQEFVKALSSLKSKDPKIYDKKTKFFEDVEVHRPAAETRKDKKFTLKDYERKVVEKGGIFEDEDSDHHVNQRPQSPSYVEEQEKLKDEFRKVVHSDAESEEEFGGIFKKKESSDSKVEKQHVKWTGDQVGENVTKSLNPLKAFWSQQDLPKQEKFLRDYIVNNGYVDGAEVSILTTNPDEDIGCENFSEDEKELELQAEFEHKYNFRFEEPDKEFIKRYPRTIENTVRKKDDKRKRKREEVKERKEKEKSEKFKEIEILKALKKKEIEEKIRKLQEVTGNDDLPFQEEDIEEEFDPVAHDRRMRELFNDEFYNVEESEEKPECPDIEELKVEDWDNYDPEKDHDDSEMYNYEPHCEDDDFNMDNDYDPHKESNLQEELIENTRSKKNRRKRRNRFMEMIKTEKPPFNPADEKSYGDYIEEYYKMDCEDIIDDLPCRFKYVETTPNDFGLTTEEILFAKTKELNQWASLKKTVQIRSEYEEKKDQRLYKLKSANEELKRKIFVSLYGPQSADINDDNQCDEWELKRRNLSTDDEPQKKKKQKEDTKANYKNSPLSTKTKDIEFHTQNAENDEKQVGKYDMEQVDLSVNDNTKKKKKKEKRTKANNDSALEQKSTSNEIEAATGLSDNAKSSHHTKCDNALKELGAKEKISGEHTLLEQVKDGRNKKDVNKTNNKIEKDKKSLSKKKKVKNETFKAKKSRESKMSVCKDRLKAYGINPRKFIKKQNFVMKNKK